MNLGATAASETKKKVKPHFHVEEKGGALSIGSEHQAEKSEPVKNKKKHLHPRDGK
jgi:hypothetical protein